MFVVFVESRNMSKECSRCESKETFRKNIVCQYGIVDHANANASSNIALCSSLMEGIGRLYAEKDVCIRSTDTHKKTTPEMMETLEPPALYCREYIRTPQYLKNLIMDSAKCSVSKRHFKVLICMRIALIESKKRFYNSPYNVKVIVKSLSSDLIYSLYTKVPVSTKVDVFSR
ncbi:MAG: hypothetical protein QXT40_03540 [Candidatus Micrarchaeia archaeon]